MAWDYSTEVLADSPYLLWRCRDVAGPTAVDSSGNSRDGTYFGADIAFGAKGIHSDETDTLVSFNPSVTTYDAGIIYNPVAAGFPSTDFTLEWVGRDFTTGTGRTLWSYSDSGGAQPDTIRVIWSNTSNRIVLHVNGVSGNLDVFTSWTRSGPMLMHFAITWRNSDGLASLYINGRLMSTAVISSGFSIPDLGSLVMCQDQDSVGGGFVVADALACIAGEFAVYDTVLSVARIRVHASAAMTRYIDLDLLPMTLGPTEADTIRPFTTAAIAPGNFVQRIFDTGVGDWVYYTLPTITATPAVLDTIPNHTNSLVPATHEVY